jgi:hypothetical protein
MPAENADPDGCVTKFFRRRWEESRADEFDAWGPATYLFEVGADGWPVRQIQTYDAGPVLRYGPDCPDDRYGGLGECQLDELEDWTPWAITPEEFEQVWRSAKL